MLYIPLDLFIWMYIFILREELKGLSEPQKKKFMDAAIANL